MKRLVSILICIAILIVSFFSLVSNALYGFDYGATNKYSDTIISKNGLYEYAIITGTSNAVVQAGIQADITVLNIPGEIDGYTITGVRGVGSSSMSLIRINFCDCIEELISLRVKTYNNDPLPLCTVSLNNGLKRITQHAYSNVSGIDEKRQDFKLIVFPPSLRIIETAGFSQKTADNIVFQSDVNSEPNSITIDDFADWQSSDNSAHSDKSCDVFFTDNVTNLSPFTFDYETYIDNNELMYPTHVPSNAVTLYVKPSSSGFERFIGSNYSDFLLSCFDEYSGWENLVPTGYTVKEYTDEWWKDVKEIQSVTISGAGVTEKADSRALGTVTNLGWSESNDPAQYLSHEYELSMKSGEKVTLSSAFAPADAYDDRMFFVSLNEDVAAVDMETGELTAIKKGAAKIRCVAASGVYSDCLLYVDGGTFADNSSENNGENTDNQSSGTSTGDIDNQSKSSFSDKAKASLASVKAAFSSTKTTLAALPSKPWFLPTAIATATALLAAILIPIARKKKRK